MKDLYTFDATTEEALQTYEAVRQAYDAFFGELKMPYLSAEASSGEIGGDISHEYHFSSKKGEDILVCCGSCGYVANEEFAESRIARTHRYSQSTDGDEFIAQGMNSSGSKQHNSKTGPLELGDHFDASYDFQAGEGESQWLGISQDRNTLVHASLPNKIETRTVAGKRYRKTEINPQAIKRIFPEINLGVEDPLGVFKAELNTDVAEGKPGREARILRIIDMRYVLQQSLPNLSNPSSISIEALDVPVDVRFAGADNMVDLVRIESGDSCPNCNEGDVKVESAVELGHTFHLGTRYSTPLEATIDADPSHKDSQLETSSIPRQSANSSDRIPVQMGCHGIGISRLMAVVADALADDKGLNWPRSIAPFEAVVIPTKGLESEAADAYDLLTTSHDRHFQGPIDAVLDDREKDFGWKIKDADIIGYPIIVILGREWKRDRKCEVQCRRLSIKEWVPANNIKAFVEGLLQQL